MILFNFNIKAELININNYVIDVDENFKINNIQQYQDDSYQVLQAYILIKGDYLYEDNLNLALKHKEQVIEIKDNKVISKNIYQNDRLIKLITYEKNISFDIDNLNKIKYYDKEYMLINGYVSQVIQYHKNSTKTAYLYLLHDKTSLNNNTLKHIKYKFTYDDNEHVIKKDDYNNNMVLLKHFDYYPKTTYFDRNNRIKNEYVFDKGYVIKHYVFYDKNRIIKNYYNFYAQTKLDSNLKKRIKFVYTNNAKGNLINSKMMQDKSQYVLRNYTYQPNTVLFKNNNTKLNTVTYYTYKNNKKIYLGYKKFNKGLVIDYNVRLNNVPYHNQFSGGYSSGCEMFSLWMGLEYKGVRTNAKYLYNHMPKSNSKPYYNKKSKRWIWDNPNEKFLGNPKGIMRNNANWGINPEGLKGLANKFRKSYPKNNFSIGLMRDALLDGNPVVVWTTFQFQKPAGYFKYYDKKGVRRYSYANFHVVLVTGMDKNNIYVTDPIFGKLKVAKNKFERSYAPYGRKALVIT
ncbi:MAG: C39 family peptidase [Bacilli bacterium]|jgi:uncharacterized protein YvpB|nr:C39 family peptidase [Bacilli bacterium]